MKSYVLFFCVLEQNPSRKILEKTWNLVFSYFCEFRVFAFRHPRIPGGEIFFGLIFNFCKKSVFCILLYKRMQNFKKSCFFMIFIISLLIRYGGISCTKRLKKLQKSKFSTFFVAGLVPYYSSRYQRKSLIIKDFIEIHEFHEIWWSDHHDQASPDHQIPHSTSGNCFSEVFRKVYHIFSGYLMV